MLFDGGIDLVEREGVHLLGKLIQPGPETLGEAPPVAGAEHARHYAVLMRAAQRDGIPSASRITKKQSTESPG